MPVSGIVGLGGSFLQLHWAMLKHHWLLEGGADVSLLSFHHLHYVLLGNHRSLPSSVRLKKSPITPVTLLLLYWAWSSEVDTVCLWVARCVGFIVFMWSGELICKSCAAYTSSMLSLWYFPCDSRLQSSNVHKTLWLRQTDIFGAGVTIHLGNRSGHSRSNP